MKEAIRPSGARSSALPFSPAIRANGFVFVSGQVAQDPETGGLVGSGDVRAQTRQALANVGRILESAGSGMDKLVKMTVFLSDIGEFAAMNEVYREVVPEPHPARSTVEAALARPEFLVEIEAVAIA
jgi:2-iminobutanoate/2-iminopropanoate deaminase